jgi:hypothetical protein
VWADLDVLLAPTEPSLSNVPDRAMWERAAAAFLRQDELLVSASPDYSSPVNTGIMLLKPHRPIVAMAAALMHGCTWTNATGFDGAGSPRARGAGNLTRLTWGTGFAEASTMRVLTSTTMWSKNTWDFVSGMSDQVRPHTPSASPSHGPQPKPSSA